MCYVWSVCKRLYNTRHCTTWQVKLIVIDSIAFHFRQDFQDMAQRTRVLAEMAQKLMHLAEEKDLAVSVSIHFAVGERCHRESYPCFIQFFMLANR